MEVIIHGSQGTRLFIYSFIGANHYFDIPFFQRNYVWDVSNWKDLLDTLCESKTSFLGSIILKQEQIRPGETSRFMVIDGQQRLTTMTILLRACYDAITASSKLSLSDDVTAVPQKNSIIVGSELIPC